jgi:hypothetical protein
LASLFIGCIASKKVNYPAPDVPAGYVLIDAYSTFEVNSERLGSR